MHNGLPIIPIFFAVDDAYIPILSVALKSLVDNSSKKYYYTIKILHTDVKEAHKNSIIKYEKENIKIEFVDLNYYIEKVKDELYTRDYYTKTTYFRLFMPELYPQYTKALYLDSDIIIKKDIAELYNTEMEDNLVAAVPDASVQTIVEFQDYVERVVGVASYKNYFNAGVLLMNLDELRKFKFQEKFLYLLKTVKYAVAQDQDYLNRLCKGRVKLLDPGWDVMPLQDNKVKVDEKDIKIVHYNLLYKPWHSDNMLHKEYFWEYAKKTEFYDEILKEKQNYTEEQRFRDMEMLKNLKELCIKETSCVGNDKGYRVKLLGKKIIKKKWYGINRRKNKQENSVQRSQAREEVLEKIKTLEKNGEFDVDVEEDPPTIPLTLDNIDYLREKRYSKFKNKLANKVGEKFLDTIIKENKLIIKEVKGIENLTSINSGAIVTCNHFNPFDSFSIEDVFRNTGLSKTKKLYKVIREGNYTNFPGLYGFFFRNCDTLPLSSNRKTMIEFMKAVDTILQRGDFILIYPEQSLWWNYKKPKPLKDGAYRFATRNNVPVIPIFITMEDSDIIGEDGFPVQEYIINIEKPIYPEANLSEKENAEKMKKENFEVWKNVYEEFYKIPLEYTTEKQELSAVNE